MKNVIYSSRSLAWTCSMLLSPIFILTGAFSICHGATPSAFPKEDSMVVCISSAILSLDPTNHRDRDTQVVIKNIFDSLTTRDKHLLVVPQLAESWRAVDSTTWEFKLKKGVEFHNGDDFTAKDVKFTLERVIQEGALDGRTSPRKTLFERIRKVKAVDAFTVRIITDTPWPILPLMLTLQEIVPGEYMKRVGSQGFENAPMGTGPFRFLEKKKDGSLHLERFDHYYGGSSENPPVQVAPLKHLVFKTVADPALRTAMLKKGQADVITHLPIEAIPLFDVLPEINVVSQPASRSYFADLNCAKPPFDEWRARVAVNYAMDRRMIVNTLFQGRAQILPMILLPQAFAFNDQLVPYPYDPEHAREMFRQLKAFRNYTVKIVCIEKYSNLANAIALFLSKAGVNAAITVGEKTAVRAAMKNREADILVTSWGNTTLDPLGIILPKLKSDGHGNFSNYSNEMVDQLLSQAESALLPETRQDCYKEIQEIAYKEAPMIFGYASMEFYGVRSRVKDFYPFATGMFSMHDVHVE